MREFNSQDLQKRTSEVQEASLIEPIVITHRGRKRYVMMSISEYERLKKANRPRVYRLSEIPDDLFAELADARMGTRRRRLDDAVE